MTKEEFFKRLEKHDWYYPFSDDFHVHNKGEADHAEIESLKKQSPVFEKMYDAFVAHYSSGSAFGTEKLPKPKFEDFAKDGE